MIARVPHLVRVETGEPPVPAASSGDAEDRPEASPADSRADDEES